MDNKFVKLVHFYDVNLVMEISDLHYFMYGNSFLIVAHNLLLKEF